MGMADVEMGPRHDVPQTVWSVDRSTLVRLMTEGVWPERSIERIGWIDQHVRPGEAVFLRVLLRNRRTWLARSPTEPDFCWRVMARLTPAHRAPCIVLFDVFDPALTRLKAHEVQGPSPAFDLSLVLAADDFR